MRGQSWRRTHGRAAEGAIVQAFVVGMSLQSIFMWNCRSNIRIVISIILSNLFLVARDLRRTLRWWGDLTVPSRRATQGSCGRWRRRCSTLSSSTSSRNWRGQPTRPLVSIKPRYYGRYRTRLLARCLRYSLRWRGQWRGSWSF